MYTYRHVRAHREGKVGTSSPLSSESAGRGLKEPLGRSRTEEAEMGWASGTGHWEADLGMSLGPSSQRWAWTHRSEEKGRPPHVARQVLGQIPVQGVVGG